MLVKVEILKSLNCFSKNGADVNAKDKYNITPLHKACYYGNIEFVKLFLQNDADVNVKDKLRDTPLQMTRDNGKVEIAKLLFEYSK